MWLQESFLQFSAACCLGADKRIGYASHFRFPVVAQRVDGDNPRACLLPDPEEQRRSRAPLPVLAVWGGVFCLQLGLCIGLAEGYDISNNTPGALVQMGWAIPGMILNFALLFWEMHRADKAAQARDRWRPGRAFWLLLMGCAVCAATQWGAAAAYAGGGVLH